MTKTLLSLGLLLACCLAVPSARAEFRSAKDMQKECRVALRVLNGTAEKNFENVLFAGECVGYIQGAVLVQGVCPGRSFNRRPDSKIHRIR